MLAHPCGVDAVDHGPRSRNAITSGKSDADHARVSQELNMLPTSKLTLH